MNPAKVVRGKFEGGVFIPALFNFIEAIPFRGQSAIG
jgi:hypothetical protein